jgi:hypothetical protein
MGRKCCDVHAVAQQSQQWECLFTAVARRPRNSRVRREQPQRHGTVNTTWRNSRNSRVPGIYNWWQSWSRQLSKLVEGERALQSYRLGVDVPANTEAEDPTVLEDGNQATVNGPPELKSWFGGQRVSASGRTDGPGWGSGIAVSQWARRQWVSLQEVLGPEELWLRGGN